MIPKPVPFFRLGLANLPILLGIDIFSFPSFCLVLLIKVLGQAFVSGTLFSYISLFSLLGTFSAGLAMYAMRKIPRKAISFVGISLVGAFVSNLFQVGLAILLIFGMSALYIIPVVFIVGTITAVLLGVFANEFTINSTWYENAITGTLEFNEKSEIEHESKESRGNEPYQFLDTYKTQLKFASGLLLLLLLLFIDILPVRAIIFLASLALCIADKQKIHFINLIIMFVAIILFNLFPPAGKIIFTIFGFNITDLAILRGLEKAVILEGMIYISKWILSAEFKFKTTFGKKIAISLSVFKQLAVYKGEVNPKKIIPTIDAILLSI